MRAPNGAELLALWEQGWSRHPIDRALLLGCWARPELAAGQVAALPLGALNAAVLRFREAIFGSRIPACADCERCSERLELSLDVGDLLAGEAQEDERPEVELS